MPVKHFKNNIKNIFSVEKYENGVLVEKSEVGDLDNNQLQKEIQKRIYKSFEDEEIESIKDIQNNYDEYSEDEFEEDEDEMDDILTSDYYDDMFSVEDTNQTFNSKTKKSIKKELDSIKKELEYALYIKKMEQKIQLEHEQKMLDLELQLEKELIEKNQNSSENMKNKLKSRF